MSNYTSIGYVGRPLYSNVLDILRSIKALFGGQDTALYFFIFLNRCFFFFLFFGGVGLMTHDEADHIMQASQNKCELNINFLSIYCMF
jgi:hypothetical protein